MKNQSTTTRGQGGFNEQRVAVKQTANIEQGHPTIKPQAQRR